MADFIPVNLPRLDGNEKRYLAECADSGWVSSEGPFVRRFEEAMAALTGRRHAVAVSSGSAALDVALEALGLEPGDEVIMPAFTIISCATAILRTGATPVLVDAEPDSWNMDVAAVEARITGRTRAILAVHIYGLAVDMEPLCALADRHGLAIIEDAAEAIGQHYRGRPCGGFGAVSVLSFYANKHVTTGEGGMVLTNDEALASRVASLRNLCFQPERRFVHDSLGWNYRMSNVQAALGLAQAERLDEHQAHKRTLAAIYQDGLAGIEGLQLPLAGTDGCDNAYWVFGLVIDAGRGLDAREAMQTLYGAGIGTRPFFWPMHEQPALLERGLFAGERHPVSENLARQGFYIPSGLGLELTDAERVVERVRGLFA